jgi:hypothetical protein
LVLHLQPASFTFPVTHVLALFFPGDTMNLLKSPVGYNMHYGRPRFVRDRLHAFYSFYPNLHNAVLRVYLRRKRREELSPKELGWLDSNFKELSDKTLRQRLSRFVSYMRL